MSQLAQFNRRGPLSRHNFRFLTRQQHDLFATADALSGRDPLIILKLDTLLGNEFRNTPQPHSAP